MVTDIYREEIDRLRELNAELLEALAETARRLHSASQAVGCYTSESYEVCDTGRCVLNREVIAKALGAS